MPKPEIFTLPVPATPGNGDARDTFRYRDKGVQFSSYTAGTFHLEVTNDVSNWLQMGANVGANTSIEIPGTWRQARVRTSSGGSVVATFAGQDFQAG